MHPYGLEEGEKIKPNMQMLPAAARVIQEKAGIYIGKVDWNKITDIVRRASGRPEAILTKYN